MNFIEYTLTSDMLCMGERIKKGQFRPTVTTIPYSQITGALKAVFGDKDIHAAGYFPFENEQEFRRRHVQILTYSPRDRATNTSIIPLYIEYLRDVKGKVFIAATDDIRDALKNESISVYMGAFKSKGFGGCTLKKCREIGEEDLEIREGLLNTRIPIAKAKDLNGMDGKSQKRLIDEGGTTEFLKNTFGIEKVVKARYGYLFEPKNKTLGWYVLSLFEGSVIKGPEFLLKDYDRGDEMNEFDESDDMLADLLDEIRKDPAVKRTRYFSSKFLNTVAEGFEKNGFEETKLFLLDKRNRRGRASQVDALLSVIKVFERYEIVKNNRKIGRLIIKTLDTLINEKKVNRE